MPATLTLGDLDESVWERYPEPVVRVLAREIVHVLGPPLPPAVAKVPLFRGAPSLADLDLPARTRNALREAGLVRDGRVVPTTAGELMRVPRIGAHSLLEALFADERVTGLARIRIGPRPSRAVQEITTKMVRKRWAARVHRADPRLGSLLLALEPDAETAADAAEAIANRDYTVPEARRMVSAVRGFISAVDATKSVALEEELDAIVTALTPRDSAKQTVLARIGLGGQPPVTLEEAGRAVSLTRERARQIERKFRDDLVNRRPVWAPVLDRALDVAADLVPLHDARLGDALVAAGISSAPYSTRSLLAAADLFGKKARFLLREDGHVVPEGHWPSEGAVRTAARKLVSGRGVATIAELTDRLDTAGYDIRLDLLEDTLAGITAFSWLDRPSGWFWIRDGPNRLLNHILKIMAVAGSVDLGQLRAGVGRHYRTKGFRPPKHVLGEFCRQVGYRVEDQLVIGPPDLPDWRDVLGANERLLVEVLFAEGPVMRRDDLERCAVRERGLRRSSFYMYLSYSPVLERYAPGVYGLRGAPVTAAQIDALIPPRVRHQVLQDHGWTRDGNVWAAFRISPASESTGVLGTPAALRPAVSGPFELTTEDGTAMGTLVIEQNMWGLTPFFRRAGVEAGDYVVIVWNIRDRQATATVGDNDLLLKYQAGE